MKLIHAKMTFIYGHIHRCRWIKITLNFKFQAHVHAQVILKKQHM